MRRAALLAAVILVSSSLPLPAPPAHALPAEATASPLGLSASDGTGLALVKMGARAVLEEPLAFTELSLTFQNPQDRVLEGTFRITLPPGAAVSRFAMRMDDGRWQEGEVVALELARRVYEDFLHRRQDPALLEQAAGNEFSARVFPIPAKGMKELVVSWSQDLAKRDDRYVLPLAGLPELGTLDVSVLRPGSGLPAVELHKTRFVPSKDMVVEQAAGATRRGLREGNHAVIRVTAIDPRLVGVPPPGAFPIFEGDEADPVSSAMVLVDTSASRALGYDAQVATLEKLLAALGGARVTVAAFDQSVELLYEGPASGASGVGKKLRERRALGASDLEAALRWAAARKSAERVVLVTDGVATAGATEGGDLVAAALSLKKAGVKRLDAVVVGGIRDGERLATLVTAGLANDGIVADGALDAEEIARKLGRSTRSGIPVAVEGATWSWPTRLDGVQPGDEALIYVDAPADKLLRVTVGKKTQEIPAKSLGTADAALLERACMKARIASLLQDLDRKADGPEQKRKIREEVVELSKTHRVLSPFTALLVLETEDDYAEYGIDREALADILTIGVRGVARTKRTDVVVAAATVSGTGDLDDEGKSDDKRKNAPAGVKDTIGVGDLEGESGMSSAEDSSLGLIGHGSGGGGSASGSASGMGVAQAREVNTGGHAMVMAPPPAKVAASEDHPSPEPMPVEQPRPTRALESTRGAGAPSGGRSRIRRQTASEESSGDAGVSDEAPSESEAEREDWAGGDGRPPYEGTFATVMELIAQKKTAEAVAKARGWREESLGDVMALVAYGTALEAAGDLETAARAYGSIIDLFPARADLRRFAGERLEHVGDKAALALAIDTYAKAAEQRPDHPASHRLLAFARVKKGEPKAAFEGLEKALEHEFSSDRFDGVDRILAEDLGLVGAAWAKAEPSRREEIRRRVRKAGGKSEDAPSLRFVLNWETDANDVDFHILDAKGGHAYYSQRELESGGELYADVTSGYGPECFTIRTPPAKRAGPYKLKAHYYSRGPMGYGMGKLQIISHDGKGGLTFEERPFVVMVDEAFVDLGEVTR